MPSAPYRAPFPLPITHLEESQDRVGSSSNVRCVYSSCVGPPASSWGLASRNQVSQQWFQVKRWLDWPNFGSNHRTKVVSVLSVLRSRHSPCLLPKHLACFTKLQGWRCTIKAKGFHYHYPHLATIRSFRVTRIHNRALHFNFHKENWKCIGV